MELIPRCVTQNLRLIVSTDQVVQCTKSNRNLSLEHCKVLLSARRARTRTTGMTLPRGYCYAVQYCLLRLLLYGYYCLLYNVVVSLLLMKICHALRYIVINYMGCLVAGGGGGRRGGAGWGWGGVASPHRSQIICIFDSAPQLPKI